MPIATNEPEGVIAGSAKHLKKLKEIDEVIYVFDGSEDDERVSLLRNFGCKVIARNTKRGKRAGAINDALSCIKKAEYIAIFDVDSRPNEEFVRNCVKALERDKRAYIASTRRLISNAVNTLTKTIELEYNIINFFLSRSKFKQFNGLIGVLNGEILKRERLREDVITEDADFATRMHVKGYKAILCEGYIYEQAPLYWKDFYNQRKRWYFGGLQLWRYLNDVLKSKNLGFKISWLSSLTLTFVPILFLPLILMALPSLLIYKKREGFKLYIGLIAYCLTLQLASLSAIVNMLKGEEIEWVAIKRSLET